MTNYATQQQNQDMVSLLASQFRLLYNPVHSFADAIGMLQMLPGVVGIWPGSFTDSNGRLMDIGPNVLHMTNNNTATLQRVGLRSYFDYDGTNQYHSVADTANLDIIGTETHITNKGLTFGAWVNLDTVAGNGVLTKWNSATGNRSYALTDSGVFQVSNTGVAATNAVTSTLTPGTGTWHFIAGRYIPSIEMAVWVNSTKTVNTTSITASIFNSNAPFAIGAFGNPAAYTNGRICLSFLCSSSILDIFINTFYQMTAPLFNVSI